MVGHRVQGMAEMRAGEGRDGDCGAGGARRYGGV